MDFLFNKAIDKSFGFGPFGRNLQHLAYKLYARAKKIQGPYEVLTPNATFAPWLSDKNFLDTYKKVQNYTLVNILQCYGLWSMVGQSAKLSGALIEVGVWRGGTGAIIGKRAALCGIKEPVYLCDTFTGVVKATNTDPDYRGGEHRDTSAHTVKKLMDELNLDNVRILEGIFPEETAHMIQEKQFRFCHIDVDVYLSAKDIVDWIWDRMVIGGALVFDDYGFRECAGITYYVNELSARSDNLFIYNLNGHGIVVKIK